MLPPKGGTKCKPVALYESLQVMLPPKGGTTAHFRALHMCHQTQRSRFPSPVLYGMRSNGLVSRESCYLRRVEPNFRVTSEGWNKAFSVDAVTKPFLMDPGRTSCQCYLQRVVPNLSAVASQNASTTLFFSCSTLRR